MSGRQAKAKRRAEGLSSEALRGQREFERQVRQLRAAKHAEAELPIVSLDPKRRRLAWVGLGLVVLVFLLGSC